MTTPAAEFSRPLALARLPSGGLSQEIEASAGECRALARRLSLPALKRLTARLRVTPLRRGGAKVTGAIAAEITQTCIVTLEDFDVFLEDDVMRCYMPPDSSQGAGDADDVDVAEGGVIDLGELVAETLALALDPYPRAPGASFRQNPDAEPPAGEP